MLEKDSSTQGLRQVLEKEKGIGPKVSRVITAALPELGKLNRGQIAQLIGVAPNTKQSGKSCHFQAPRGGRTYVRQLLFIAAMSATRHNPTLRAYYQGLLTRGKKKIVAMVAAVRKLIIHLNSITRDFYRQQAEITV